ncbi:MAG: hypothetical protein WB424_01305 [Terracidiphilus sp.]
MPTLAEWEQALTVPRRVIVESSQNLVQQVQQRHARKDAQRKQGQPAPPRKNNLTVVQTFAPELAVPVVPAYLLHRLGVVTTPSVENLADISSTWAYLRYLWAFRIPEAGERNPLLRLSEEARRIDFHQKALLSDEIGVGMAAVLLGTYFNAPLAVDVSIAMQEPTWQRQIVPQNDSSPDYLFFDSTQTNLYVVECKGTQSARSNSLNQVRRGTEQVQALNFTNRATPPSLVIATCLSKKGTRVLLIDPPGEDDSHPPEKPERVSEREWIIRDAAEFVRSTRLLSNAKVLSFSGADEAAANMLERTHIREQKTFRYAARETQMAENEFGQFRGVRQRVAMKDRMNIEVFQALDRRVYDAVVAEDSARTDEEMRAFQRRAIAASREPHTTQPVSTSHENGTLVVRSAGPDGSLLEIRVSAP